MAKVALVTGGTRGIGHAISEGLKNAGYTVVANYASNDEAANTFKSETGIEVAKFDVGDFDAVQAAVKDIEAAHGPIDVLVNNAGITRDKPLHKMDKAHWDAVIRTDLDSIFNLSRAVIEGMRERKFGRIISISSINGQKGQFAQANYAATKAGDIGFTKSLAQEGARAGITANIVAPGYINTEMMSTIPEKVMNEVILPQIPVGRLGEASEIARAVCFLASDDAGFVTGSTLSANGGQYMV